MKVEIKAEIAEKIDEIASICEDIFYLIPLEDEGGRKTRAYFDTLADDIRDTIYREMGVEVGEDEDKDYEEEAPSLSDDTLAEERMARVM